MSRFLSLLAVFASALLAQERAKNVVLFLGDAAGIAVINIASIHAGKPQQLYIQKMPHIGLMDTSSASNWVTDSAAGMTAIVTGQKTHNGVISQSDAAVRGKKDGEPLKTILEYAEERGLSTGVISNDAVTGATPASCYAHANDRRKQGEIMAQVLKPPFGDGVDVLIGAGRVDVLAAASKLGLDIVPGLRSRGYRVCDSLDQIPANAMRVVALLDSSEFDLGLAVRRATEILSRNPKGFFLMVESDLHTDKLKRGLDRTVAFDAIIAETAERMKNDTLVIFTADHSFDTRLKGGRKGQPLLMEPVSGDGGSAAPKLDVSVDGGHTGEQVVVAATGPGAERVRGFFPNTQLFRIMMAAYGW